MDDQQIIELYWARSEDAISETAEKYGKYCYSIAYSILKSHEDSEECVNDTYLKAWNTIPPQRPGFLSAFLGKITRRSSLDKFSYYHAQKRGNGQVILALEELQECIPHTDSVEQAAEDILLVEILNRFVTALPAKTQTIFLRRYWYLNSIREIASDLHISESKTKMTLLRTRQKLRQTLEKEGILL